MNFKKCFVFLLIALVVLPLIPFSLFAAGDPVLSYEVLVDGVDITEAESCGIENLIILKPSLAPRLIREIPPKMMVSSFLLY